MALTLRRRPNNPLRLYDWSNGKNGSGHCSWQFCLPILLAHTAFRGVCSGTARQRHGWDAATNGTSEFQRNHATPG